jgi:hypothetical protein
VPESGSSDFPPRSARAPNFETTLCGEPLSELNSTSVSSRWPKASSASTSRPTCASISLTISA